MGAKMGSTMSKELYAIIQNQRAKHGWSQEQLAAELGIPRTAISQIENNERGVSSTELKKLTEIFGVTADFLLGLESAPQVILEKAPAIKKVSATQERISVPHYQVERFKQVLLYLLERCGGKPNVGETVIYKLLYFADFNFYELFEEQLTGATYRKLQHGPVPLEFKDIVNEMIGNGELQIMDGSYCGFKQRRYIPLKKADLNQLSAAEKTVLDSVVERFSDKSATWLSNYSHDDIPWKATAEKEVIDYELVFYRTPAYSVRDDGVDTE
jgi:transcriptional regulator with XRE-family HTH domain